MTALARFLDALAITALLANAGCDSCGRDKPYTPFGVASSVPMAASGEAPPAAPSGSALAPEKSGFAVQKALVAPANAAQRWQLEGFDLRAPQGRAFAQAVLFDADGDGQRDALAWTVPAANAGQAASAGELWSFPSGKDAVKVLSLPGFVPTGPGCQLEVTLSQTGPRTATLEASAACQVAMIARSPTRALAVVAPAAERPRVLVLRVAAPAPEETLKLAVDSSDQDADGRDDVRLTVTVARQGTSESAAAELGFFDRAAGVSRNTLEPAETLARFASRETVRAKSKKNAPSVLERVDSARRLLSTLCAESGTPRLFDEDNNPIRCGNLEKSIDFLAAAEQTAALTLGDPTRAASVLARDGWYVRGVSATQRKQLERDLAKTLTQRELNAAVSLVARPKQAGRAQWSPLWFEASGELLVQTSAGVMRVAADGSSETPLDPEAGAPWPLELASASGVRLVDLIDSCDRSEIALSVADGSGPKPALPTSVLAPRPGACGGRGRTLPRFFAPLRFLDSGLEALIAGVWTKPPTGAGASPQGSARSPDGRVLVTPHPLGLLVLGSQNELWNVQKLGGELAAPDKFEHCVVANSASAVACVVGGRARLFLKP
jgi:hypothetical protein